MSGAAARVRGRNLIAAARSSASHTSTTTGEGPLLPKHPQLASPRAITIPRISTNIPSRGSAIMRLNRGSSIMAKASRNSVPTIARSAVSRNAG